ncbi:two-component sensor histidine kinase [Cutibacterium avidum]|uniref:sensor histidine kinase n=1 Tax=Cutibacterium avidum TaxID=33010 RepID=UPI0008F5C4BE|nr:ATP-binding protein [Cutibacterium avidum]MCO6631338.1 two-component sensor histidine kinase [Cutibacterium avidum]MCO6659923.1 two-component sensor histidine kinase [Cutibacterium avidum]MCO6664589.1 two-component sensor histidine kinase [Cutibacterium avidum]MCT1417286.1 ATP-binding protein [Cutibacterium avidum]MCX8467896.1 ATP-binding protein [Cutibacterium avidum]
MQSVGMVLAAIIGAVVGAGLTVLIIRAVESSRHPVDTLATDIEALEVDPTLARALDLATEAAVIVGPHDEVLHTTVGARSMELVRGSRIADAALLNLVRTARREDRDIVDTMELKRASTGANLILTVRVGPLDGHGNAIISAADSSRHIRLAETRRDFVANVSHELKTPIGAVSILAEAIEGAADDPDAVRHFSQRLTAESTRLSALVTQIIDLSRLQADEPLLRAEPVSVADIVDEAVSRHRELATTREVSLVARCDDDLWVLGDQSQLTEAIANLVQNAIVYSEPKARVAVSARRVHDVDTDVIEIAVADNGIGIGDADQERIFERFYRVDYSRSRENGGTGLGLSLVKHTCQAHGGSVDVWSKLGQGSTFTLRLPTLDADHYNESDQEES